MRALMAARLAAYLATVRLRFTSRAIMLFFAITTILGRALLAERELESVQQSTAFFVCFRGCADGDVETANDINLVVVDFREHDLFADADAVIAPAIERFRIQATEIANSRQRDIDQAIEKFIHADTP